MSAPTATALAPAWKNSAAFSILTPACRNHQYLRQRRLERLDVAGSAGISRREDLDQVRARLPCPDHLGRRQRSRDGDHRIAVAHLDGWYADRGADKELRASQHAGSRRFGVEHRSRAERNLVAKLVGHFFENPNGARDCHGDFQRPNTSPANGLGRLQRLLGRVGPHDRHDPDFEDRGQYLIFRHVKNS